MKTSRLIFLAVLAVAIPLAAASDNAAKREAASRWSVLQAQSPRSTAIDWNQKKGTPLAIYGLFSRPLTPNAESARRFVADNAALLRIGDPRELIADREFDSPMGHHVVFTQSHRGVPVYGAEVSVHFNAGGEVIALNNTFVPDLDINTRPSLTARQAMDRGPRTIDFMSQRDHDRRSAELVIYDNGDDARLAWRIIEMTARQTWESFVDAQNGDLLVQPRDINRYATGSGKVFTVNAVVATHNTALRDNSDAASAVPASAYSTVSLLNLAGNGFLDGTFVSTSATKKRVSNASNSFLFDRSSDGFSETMCYYYIDYAQRYIQSLGFTNVNNRKQVVSANGTRQDNSWYTSSNKQITYGTGGVDDAEDAEIVLHEYGHSIQDNQKPGFGSTAESGAMGEGFGDYWGGTVNAQLSGGFQDTCVGDWDSTSYDTGTPPCLRRLDTTKHYPQSVQGEVHADGEIWSGALWQIRASLGATKADKLVLQHHFLITAGSTFNQASNALVTAAINLGYTATEVNNIRTILRNRGFTVTA